MSKKTVSIGLGNALIGSLMAWRLLGRRTRLMTQHLGSATMPDFFGKRFMSAPLKVVASIIVFIFLIPYTASLYNGLSRLFETAFGIDYVWCVLAMAAGLIIVPLVSLISKNSDQKSIDNMFRCYEQTVTVRAATALNEEQE